MSPRSSSISRAIAGIGIGFDVMVGVFLRSCASSSISLSDVAVSASHSSQALTRS